MQLRINSAIPSLIGLKKKVKRHLEFLTKKQPPQTVSQHHIRTTDNSDSSTGSSATLANLKEIKDNFEFLPELVHMPQVTYKSHSSNKKHLLRNVNLNTQFHLWI